MNLPDRGRPHLQDPSQVSGSNAVERKEVLMTRHIAHAAGIGVLVLVLALSPAALADKGGNGNGNGNGKPGDSDAWVSASPNPVSASSRVELEGCGYEVEPVQVRVIDSAGETETYGAGMWYTGCFGGYITSGEAGTYTVEVWQHGSKHLHLMASTTLSVV
jgi:hypothetical protein